MSDEIPEACADALAKWDAGEMVPSVSMGGLGDDYERAIQTTAFELIRRFKDHPLPGRNQLENAVNEIDEQHNLGGLTGAMAGAAMNLASMVMRHGYRAALELAPADRIIQVSKQAAVA